MLSDKNLDLSGLRPSGLVTSRGGTPRSAGRIPEIWTQRRLASGSSVCGLTVRQHFLRQQLIGEICWLKLMKALQSAALRKYTVHQDKTPSTLKKLFDSNSELSVSSFGSSEAHLARVGTLSEGAKAGGAPSPVLPQDLPGGFDPGGGHVLGRSRMPRAVGCTPGVAGAADRLARREAVGLCCRACLFPNMLHFCPPLTVQ